jgi:hypothetical protein
MSIKHRIIISSELLRGGGQYLLQDLNAKLYLANEHGLGVNTSKLVNFIDFSITYIYIYIYIYINIY